jgi:pimeloyl-ACP methyl ester carboxylesterase
MNDARPRRSAARGELATAQELPHEQVVGGPRWRWGPPILGYHSCCPVLVAAGTLGPDWAGPRAEGPAIVDTLPSGLGRLEIIEGAGRYPHVQFPDRLVSLMLAFLQPDAARA